VASIAIGSPAVAKRRRTSMKPIVIVEGVAIATLALSHTALTQGAEKANQRWAQELFDQARARYEAYELEHGGWIETKNVRTQAWVF
jgi:hypothetical protein